MKYCGAPCRNRRLKRLDYKRQKGPLERRPCDVCAEPFQQTKRNQRYCSKLCYKKGWPLLNREKHNTRSRERRAANPQWYAAREPGYQKTYKAKILSKNPWAYLLSSRRNEAKQKGLPFELTPEWARERWTGRCELTDLEFRIRGTKGPHPFSPSIDQIAPGQGYTPDNARFVLMGVNALKGVGTDQDVYEIAEALIRSRQEKGVVDNP